MTPRHLILCCAAAALLTSCGDPPAPVVTGAVTDARSGDALADARIHATGRSTRSSRDGYYMLEGVGAGDTLLVTRPGYESSTLILRAEPGEGLKLLRNVTLARIPDTAYTATGPVDVEAFLENRDLTPKKLSPNEARLRVMEKFPGYKISRGQLVKVSGNEEWLFDMRTGRASVTVYIDAHSGAVRSLESDDPNLDRKLQDAVGR